MKKLYFLFVLLVIAACSEDSKTTFDTDIPAQIVALSATYTQVDVDVYGGNTGSVVIKPVGGTPPYEITPSQTGLTAKKHVFTIADSKGQTFVMHVTIKQPKAVMPVSSLLMPAIKNINKKSSNGKSKVIAKHLVQSIQYEKNKYKIDFTSDFSLTDNLYSIREDTLNLDTPKGDVRNYLYNDLGQLVQVRVQRASGSMGESGIESSYEYDKNGNVINNKTPYTYENGLIVSVLVDGYLTKYTYDAQARVVHRLGVLNSSTFEYTNDEVKETRYEVVPSLGEVANGRVVITKYDNTKAGIYNNEPFYKISTVFSSVLGQALPNPYLHIIDQKIFDNGLLLMGQSYKYFYDADGYLIKVDDGAYVTVYRYE